MTKKSTLLKVAAIIMIVFGAITLIASATLQATVMAGMSMLNSLGADAFLQYVGISLGLFRFFIVWLIIASIVMLLVGILGLVLKKKKTLVLLGCISIIFEVIALILAIAAKSFSWYHLVDLVLPILYFLGARQSID